MLADHVTPHPAHIRELSLTDGTTRLTAMLLHVFDQRAAVGVAGAAYGTACWTGCGHRRGGRTVSEHSKVTFLGRVDVYKARTQQVATRLTGSLEAFIAHNGTKMWGK